MKVRDTVIIAIIGLNFSWFGWRIYAANHIPPKRFTTVFAQEVIGNAASLSENLGGKYVFVEFGDYQCAPCAQMYTQIANFTTSHTDTVRFQFRQYPLPGHSLAFPAALMAEKARKIGKFESIHKTLYGLGAHLDEETLRSIATQYGIAYTSSDDLQKQDKEYEAIIDNDKRIANKIPVTGTPSLFLCTPDQKVYQISTMQQAEDIMR